MEELISIIMPTYNCGNFIAESVESVINQTYSNWELIIVDDCSTDDTETVIKKYSGKDERIKFYKLSVNSGAAVARNYGTNTAQGVYIAFLDSDDLWHENKLKKQIDFMKDNKYAFTCTTYAQIDESGKKNGVVIKVKKKVDYNAVLLSCPIGNSTVIYNANILGKIEIPNIRKRNDDALWLKILKIEKYAYGLDEKLMLYRVRKNSLSRNKIELVKYHWYLYRKIEKLSVVRSAWHIFCWIIIKILKIK
ncbi:glycosyltransferase family 2 protein [Lutibacter sp. B2]|nr:glycosyltransferase family 2 protein [Lutibacter sp. B2]